MSGCDCEIEIKNKEQKNVLITLLAINGFMFLIEITLGWYAQSTGLIADSFDMLADAIVYAIGIYAIGRSLQSKAKAALLSGWFQFALALLIVFDVTRRVLLGSEPISAFMMIVGVIALIANIYCLVLIDKHKSGEVHMRASWIFSANDVIANLGVIIAGVLVMTLNQRWPDIVIGSIISALILRGAYRIINDVNQELAVDKKVCGTSGEKIKPSSCCSK